MRACGLRACGLIYLAAATLVFASACDDAESGTDEPDAAIEGLTLEPELPTDPAQIAAGDLHCLGDNEPEPPTGGAIELTGYVRALADPEANEPPPAANVEAFTAGGTSLGAAPANPEKGKDGRVSLSVPVQAEGFTGYSWVTHEGFLDYRFQTSLAVTSTAVAGWAWMITQDEVDTQAEDVGVLIGDGTGILVGAVHDCESFGVENAVIQVVGKTDHLRRGEDQGDARVLYVDGFAATNDRTFTSDTGRFVVPNLGPGRVEVRAYGRLRRGGPLTLLSSIETMIEAGKISSIALQPRAK